MTTATRAVPTQVRPARPMVGPNRAAEARASGPVPVTDSQVRSGRSDGSDGVNQFVDMATRCAPAVRPR